MGKTRAWSYAERKAEVSTAVERGVRQDSKKTGKFLGQWTRETETDD